MPRSEQRPDRRARSAGFTLVELTIVVVISTLALIAIYQTLITQQRTYRYQTAAIDAQGTSRMALAVIANELREISASAGATANMGGTDLLMASRDSLRIRALRKVGIVCSVADSANGTVDVWVPGDAFESDDEVLYFAAGNTNNINDDKWGAVKLSGVGSAKDAACATRWPTYAVQNLQGIGSDVASMQPGSIVRSYVAVAYANTTYDGMNVVGRSDGGALEPLVGPILPPDSGGLEFRYFDASNNEVTSLGTASQRSAVARVLVTVRAVSRGGDPMGGGDWVDSVTTNIYLRGN